MIDVPIQTATTINRRIIVKHLDDLATNMHFGHTGFALFEIGAWLNGDMLVSFLHSEGTLSLYICLFFHSEHLFAQGRRVKRIITNLTIILG